MVSLYISVSPANYTGKAESAQDTVHPCLSGSPAFLSVYMSRSPTVSVAGLP